jgi:3-oxoacyl-[acyl-carrier-protein] synthase II
VNTHATSTGLGDVSEMIAIQRVLKGHPAVISATKSMTGHLLGAAGAVESIISILSIRDNIVPATINTTVIDEEIPQDLNILLGEAKPMTVNYVLNNTFGFGGHTATTIFKKFSA